MTNTMDQSQQHYENQIDAVVGAFENNEIEYNQAVDRLMDIGLPLEDAADLLLTQAQGVLVFPSEATQ